MKSQISAQLTQQAQQEVFTQFVSNYTSKWQARTFCASGYVIERCSNYIGTGRPSKRSPGLLRSQPQRRVFPPPVRRLSSSSLPRFQEAPPPWSRRASACRNDPSPRA